jgi:hypothetical protein
MSDAFDHRPLAAIDDRVPSSCDSTRSSPSLF